VGPSWLEGWEVREAFFAWFASISWQAAWLGWLAFKLFLRAEFMVAGFASKWILIVS